MKRICIVSKKGTQCIECQHKDICLSGLIHILICNTKIGEKSDMTKSRVLGFAACHKQELFVAQELINKVKIKVLRNLGPNKIRKTHTFWRHFFNHVAIWLHAFTYYRPDTWSEMPQYYRLSIQRDYSFSDERVLLLRLMRGGWNIASNAPSLISSSA